VKKAAVVILNWNGEKLLEQFLPSVVNFSPQATIYLADNASDDNSVAFIKANFPSVKIIRNSENFGFAKGYNDALKYVEEEIYSLVNSDVEVTENWLVPILELFEREPQTAIIQPKILDYKNRKYFEYAGAAGGFIDKFGYPFCRGRIFDTIEKDEGQYDDETEIFWASGACFFIRKEVFREIKCFDADFFAHQEEIDLCWRAINRNYKIKYCGFSTVYHVGGATLNDQDPKKTYLNFRNSLSMLVKNLPQKHLLWILIARLLLDGVAAARFLTQWKLSHIAAVIKAHFWFYVHFEKNYDKRSMFQKRKYFLLRSIVTAYFINKKKTFPTLF
jgi:GT2 family glycosyltransferase